MTESFQAVLRIEPEVQEKKAAAAALLDCEQMASNAQKRRRADEAHCQELQKQNETLQAAIGTLRAEKRSCEEALSTAKQVDNSTAQSVTGESCLNCKGHVVKQNSDVRVSASEEKSGVIKPLVIYENSQQQSFCFMPTTLIEAW